MVRPLYRESANILAEMTNSQLERLVYTLQRAYANQLDNGGNGHINVGGSGTSIGSATDTVSTVQTSGGVAAPPNNGVQSYPSPPGIGNTGSGSFSYKQDRGVPSFPSNTAFDEKGFVKHSFFEIIKFPIIYDYQFIIIIYERLITSFI